MNILIISDTHGKTRHLQRIYNQEPVDAVIFLGDVLRDLDAFQIREDTLVYAVRGNGDAYCTPGMPKQLILDLEGHRLLLTHGHEFYVHTGTGRLEDYALEHGCDIVLFGHTHVRLERCIPGEKPLYLFNPGSFGEPRDGNPPSYGRLLLTPQTVLFSFGDV